MSLPDPNDYPRWLYHRTESGLVVNSREEEEAAAALGWMRSPPSAEPLPEAAPESEAPEPPEPVKECSKCRETKPVSEFYRQGRRRNAQCKGCINAYLRARRETSKEQPRAGGASPRLITVGAGAHPLYMRVEFTADFELFGMRFHRGDAVEMNKDLAARAVRAGVAAVPQEPEAA